MTTAYPEQEHNDIHGKPKELELIVPKARGSLLLNVEYPDSFGRLKYSMMKSAHPLRPKTISRQSCGSGDLDRDWVDVDTELSCSSRLAKSIYCENPLFYDTDVLPMNFDDLWRIQA